jgi:hypothetical protein
MLLFVRAVIVNADPRDSGITDCAPCIYEKSLSRVSVARGSCLMKKTQWSKILCKVHLNVKYTGNPD